MQWFYATDGQRNGPVSVEEFERLVRENVIRPETLVWRQGMQEWQAYSVAMSLPPRVDDGTEVCVVSGRRYPRREMVQFEGRWISAEHRDEYFQRLREGVPDGTMEYGGFWVRFAAKFLDGLINYVIGMIINGITAFAIFGTPNYFHPSGIASGRGLLFQAISIPAGIVAGLAYSWFFLSRYEATPGKMAMGLKIVRSDGSKLSTGRIIGRYFAEWISSIILCIGYIMAGFDEEKRTLHDRICDTRVIKK